MTSRENDIDPLDVQVGDDGDAAGIAQTITTDDIQAILSSPEPVEERREQLNALRNGLEVRMSADRGHEFEPLIEDIDRAIAQLDEPAGDAGGPSAYAMDDEGRSDGHAPDDELDS